MSRKSGIRFQQMPCIVCGSARILGTTCSDCGRRGPTGEVNSDVVRRRSSLRAIAERVDAVACDRDTGDSLPGRDEIVPLVEELAEGINVFAQSNGSAFAVEKLSEVLSRLSALRWRASRVTSRRPTIALTRATNLTLDRLAEVWPAWEKVLRSGSIAEVQLLAPIAQDLLDNASADFADYRAVADAVAAYEDHSEPNILKRSLNSLSFAYPHLSLLDLGTQGACQATKEIGIPVSQSMGAEFLALHAIANVHFDPERFAEVIKEAALFCFKHPHLVEISQSQGAIDGLAHSQRLILESLKSFEAVLQVETNSDSLLRRIIILYGEIYEDVAAPVFAWYCRLAGLKFKSYEQLMKMNATQLAGSLDASSVTTGWFLGAKSYLRNAAGHGRSSYSIAGDTVTFKLNSFSQAVPVAEILDTFFALFESLAALSWSLANALEQVGIDIPMTDEDAEYAGLSAFNLACLTLERSGEILHNARNQDRIWEIELGDGEIAASNIVMTFVLQNHAGFLCATVNRRGTKDALLTMPASLVAEVIAVKTDDSDPEELLLAILRLRSEAKTGGKPVLTRQDIEFAVSAFSLHFLSPNILYGRYLREVRNIALSAGHLDAVDLCDRVFAEFRHPNPVKAHRLAADLHKYVHHDAPVIPSSNCAQVVTG